MKKRSRILKTLGVILSCTMVFNLTMPVCAEGSGQDNNTELAAPSQSREEAEAAKDELQQNLDEVNGRIYDLETAKGSLEQNVAELDGKLNEISERLQTLSDDLSTRKNYS